MRIDGNDPEEIIRAVRMQDEETRSLRDRMEGDYRLYRLEPFREVDADGVPVEGYRSYTSNAPQVFADKVIQWIARSEFHYRIPQAGRTRRQREADDLKERWTRGVMAVLDRQLLRRMEPPMRDVTAFYNAVRGMVAGRWLMMNTRSGETVVDMTPWDPLRTYWSVGPDGLEWACYRVRKTRGEIWSEYGVDAGGGDESAGVLGRGGGDAEVDVFDYYDRERNTVVAGNGVVLKRPTPHGGERVPVVIAAAGAAPLARSDWGADYAGDYGESVFKSNRGIYDKQNLMMSIFLELAARSRKPPLGVRSRDGRKSLDDDPYREGTTISMAEGDDIQPFPLLQTTQDAASLTGQISGEVQRGSIPFSVFGELQFQLSGFAINTLRSGLDSLLRPRLTAETAFYSQGLELLTEQYASGRFAPLHLSASYAGRFDASMTPEAVSRGGEPEIRLDSNLPEDDTAKFAQARIAREGAVPLLPDRWIYDNILKIRDADNIEQAVSAQMARRGTPESLMLGSMLASADRGEEEYARLYAAELRLARARKLLELQTIQGGTAREDVHRPSAEGGAQSRDGSGMPPEVLPDAFMRPPTPPSVPPGPAHTRREAGDGAPTDAQRLAALGLVGPRG